jgi:hypothetical protein
MPNKIGAAAYTLALLQRRIRLCGDATLSAAWSGINGRPGVLPLASARLGQAPAGKPGEDGARHTIPAVRKCP